MTTEDRQADQPPDDTMTLTEHLGELRARIIRSALAITVGMVLVVAFYDQVLGFLLQPYQDLCARKPRDFCSAELFNFTPTEGLTTRLRVGMYGGIILALPVILWQVWRFIVPALNKKEKQYAIPFVAVVDRAVHRRRRTRLLHGRTGPRLAHLAGPVTTSIRCTRSTATWR